MKMFVDTEYRGHHSEYLNLLVENFIKTEKPVLFIVHPEFLHQRRNKIKYSHIKFLSYEPGNDIFKRWREFSYILATINQFNINSCCLLNMNFYFLLLPFFKLKNCFFSGIYFLPFLRKENVGIREKLIKTIIFKFILSKRNFTKILILNDKKGVDLFNEYFLTKKFKYLIDPVISLCKKHPFSTPHKKSSITNFCFIGEVSERKGISQLLKAIEYLDPSVKENIQITIAGNVPDTEPEIKKKINYLYKKEPWLFNEIHLERISDFNFERILTQSDIILCLHQKVEGSSGIIGKAAIFSKPVIGPQKGVVGELIREYQLGLQIDTTDYKKIAEGIIRATHKEINVNEIHYQNYLNDHTPYMFVNELVQQ